MLSHLIVIPGVTHKESFVLVNLYGDSEHFLVLLAAVYKMEGLKRDANALNKEIGTLRKVLEVLLTLLLHPICT